MKPVFHLQKDLTDCGASCLQNILAGYKVNMPLEMLRVMCGTSEEGATLLGLHQAAQDLGFSPMGAEAESIDNLAEVTEPCILHLTVGGRSYHYVVFYPPAPGAKQDLFTIGDPASGIEHWDRSKLEERWQSKTLLLLKPTGKLQAMAQRERSKWSWLWTIVKKDLDLLYLAAFFGLIIAILNLSTAIFSQKFLDNILPGHRTQKVVLATVLFGILLLLRCGITRLRSVLLARQSYQFNLHLTSHFFGSLLYLPKSFFDGRRTGDLTTRLNDIGRIQQALSYIVGDIGVQALFLLVSLGLAFSYSVVAGVACLIVLPLQFWVVKRHERSILTDYHEAMKANALKESSYIETLNGISTIKVMNQEPLFIRQGKGKMEFFQQALLKLGYHRIRFAFDSDLVGAGFMTSIVIACALLATAGKLTTGQWIAILQLAAAFLQAASALALTNLQLQEARAALERIVEFNHIQPEYPQPAAPILATPSFQHLSVSNLTFRYRGRGQLLRNISLEVAKGEIVSVIGESGQGKSTLFQILQKMAPPDSGQVLLNHHDWQDCEPVGWRQMLGVVPQDINVFGGTLLENIAFEDAVTKPEKVIEFCRKYGFDRHFARLHHGSRTILGEGGTRLSGGERQLLGLARCLYREPGLLLLDEPTSAMDAALREWVAALLQEVKQHAGIIIISHDGEWAARTDRTYCLKDGILQEKKSFYVH